MERGDPSYENEVRVLSALQRLKHPNILKLTGCYTQDSDNNLISPYVAGGTLRKYLRSDLPTNFSREEVINSMAGLASAVWALHEFTSDDTEISHKGHHQDLRPDNILIDGTRFILADFGLSSIKAMEEMTRTPFKGRRGYYQGPECAELERPFSEYATTRATDIWSLACILTDIIVHFVRGPAGVQAFENARQFHLPPISYHLYHKGTFPNEAVAAMLEEISQEDTSSVMQDLRRLIHQMLDIQPRGRPNAASVTACLYICTIEAFAIRLNELYSQFGTITDARVEKARFESWKFSQDLDLYRCSSGATKTSELFDSVVEILRQLKEELSSIVTSRSAIDSRTFLEVRVLNTQLLNLLSPERGDRSRAYLHTLILEDLSLQKIMAEFSTTASLDHNSLIAQEAEMRHRTAQVEVAEIPGADVKPREISKSMILDIREVGRFKTAKIRQGQQTKKLVIIESINYQDVIRQEQLRQRVNLLCELVSKFSSVPAERALRMPPFFGLYVNAENMSFDVMYGFPQDEIGYQGHTDLMSLHDLLLDPDASNFPTWETRCTLASNLAESLASFHDVNWYHKDLLPFNILFFPSRDRKSLSTRATSPYLLGFHHSRMAKDDFTEGPLQDRKYQRYHHPKYISVQNYEFTRFRPEFDYYSLGILLIEIGLWTTIDVVMKEHAALGNQEFYEVLMQQKVSLLSFHMGSWYEDVVRHCLTASSQPPDHDMHGNEAIPSVKSLFSRKVVIPLKAHSNPLPATELTRKRERENDNTHDSATSRRRIH